MKHVLPILYLILSTSLQASAAPSCRNSVKDEDLTQGITNAKIEVASYRQPNARPLSSILVSLGYEATQFITNLKPGSVVVDSGSGFSIAGVQLAQKKSRVFAINAQNAWEYFAYLLKHNPEDRIVKKIVGDAISELGIPIKGTNLKVKDNGHGPWVDVDSAKAKDLRIIGERLLHHLKSLHESENFNYMVGFSDVLLKGTENFADLIIDNWGAIYYSPNRSLLFDSYFRALKPNGKAFLRIKDSEGNGVLDVIQIKSGKKTYEVRLIDYLTENYPDIFVVVNGGATLMIKKGSTNTSLNLQDILVKVKEDVGHMNNGTYPIVTWRLK